MESSQHKVLAKTPTAKVTGLAKPASPGPSLAVGQPAVIRAKVSGLVRSRAHTSTSSTVSASGTAKARSTPVRSNLTPDAVVRSPSPAKFTVRSPSPSKFVRPLSPVKPLQQAKLTGRTPASISKVTSRARVDKSTTSIITVFDDSHTPAPSAPSLLLQSKDVALDTVSKASTSSLRIKAKVTNLPKPTSQMVPTIVSPPSPPSTVSSMPSPSIPSRPRVRAMTTVQKHLPPMDESLLIPLPTSPPASTLSFSSHSSTSISSVRSSSTHDADTPPIMRSSFPSRDHLSKSTSASPHEETVDELKQSKRLVARVRADTRISGGTGPMPRYSLNSEHNGSMEGGGSLSDEDETLAHPRKASPSPSQEREEEERAEAKSNRKIADLEITTKSLLVINTSLEAAKARQASEIRELRRRLRQARLALPPRSYKLLPEDDKKPEEENEDEESTDADDEKDECFQRVKHILDDLLMSGRKALAVPAPSFDINPFESMSTKHAESQVLSLDSQKSSADMHPQGEWKHGVAIGSRVLSAEEAKKWNEDTERDLGDNPESDIDTSHTNTLEEEEVEQEVGIFDSNQDTVSTGDISMDTPANVDIPP